MMGTGEEAEVGRTARVVEQVTLRKRAEEHEATVRDTVRRTAVEVEELEAGPRDRRR
jgi:stress response protein YsnF